MFHNFRFILKWNFHYPIIYSMFTFVSFFINWSDCSQIQSLKHLAMLKLWEITIPGETLFQSGNKVEWICSLPHLINQLTLNSGVQRYVSMLNRKHFTQQLCTWCHIYHWWGNYYAGTSYPFYFICKNQQIVKFLEVRRFDTVVYKWMLLQPFWKICWDPVW